MYYVERLRVGKGLLVLAIVLAIVGALVVATIWLNHVYPVWHGARGVWPLSVLFAVAGNVAAIYAFAISNGLVGENDGHLPVAWTKPMSHTRLAFNILALDALGILAAFGITFGAATAVTFAIGGQGAFYFTGDQWPELVRFILFPLAYFGIIVAATASLGKIGRGVSWAPWGVSWFLALMAQVQIPKPWPQIFATINLINPITYGSFMTHHGKDSVIVGLAGNFVVNFPMVADILALLLLCVVGVAAALVQWRRLEA